MLIKCLGTILSGENKLQWLPSGFHRLFRLDPFEKMKTLQFALPFRSDLLGAKAEDQGREWREL